MRDVLRGERRLARAGRADEQRRRAPGEAAAEQPVHLGDAALHRLRRDLALPGRLDLREHGDAAAVDGEVVEALGGRDAAELDDAQPPPRPAVFERQLLQQQHAVAEALQLRVLAARLVVQQQHRGVHAGEVGLQRQDLAAEPQRIARQQLQLAERVEDDAGRPQAIDDRQQGPDGVAELDLGRMVEGVLFLDSGVVRRRQLEQLDAVEGPAVRRRDGAQLVGGLGERHVEPALAAIASLEEELHRDGRLAGPGTALDQVHPVRGPSVLEQRVQSADPGRHGRLAGGKRQFRCRHGYWNARHPPVLAGRVGLGRSNANVSMHTAGRRRSALDTPARWCKDRYSCRETSKLMLPTEPIGSIPRPPALLDAIAEWGSDDPRLEPLYEAAIEDTIREFEATGSPVVTDGEQRKLPQLLDLSGARAAQHGPGRVPHSVHGRTYPPDAAADGRPLPLPALRRRLRHDRPALRHGPGQAGHHLAVRVEPDVSVRRHSRLLPRRVHRGSAHRARHRDPAVVRGRRGHRADRFHRGPPGGEARSRAAPSCTGSST